MSDFINNLIKILEPTILDIDDKEREFSEKTVILDELSKMLEFVDNDIEKVGLYDNQQFIIDNLTKLDSNEIEYTASCYLLSSDDKNVKLLPQYIESSNYIEKLIESFKKWHEELSVDVKELEAICDNKKVNKKYLEIFKEENPIVDDVDEFSNFLEKQELVNKDKIDILIYTIKNNVNSYLQKEKVKGR